MGSKQSKQEQGSIYHHIEEANKANYSSPPSHTPNGGPPPPPPKDMVYVDAKSLHGPKMWSKAYCKRSCPCCCLTMCCVTLLFAAIATPLLLLRVFPEVARTMAGHATS